MTLSRRDALTLLAGGPVAAALAWTPAEAEQAAARARQAPRPFAPAFFTPHEYATVRALVDLIIPRDERSGSATDAGVPEFMDFMMADQPRRQTAMRGGLALVDVLALERFDRRFLDAPDPQRRSLLDEIAYTTNDDPAVAHAVAFFSTFRDLTASGFWTTKMGIDDLRYEGNRFVSEWNGCPDAALKKLGL
ncbi:MAG TPA: gluconate 2-dehydrogenase subunit 3 family protein [Vicinamibacterales bacterium]|nr:gluconate 2-dehydrogenase subunit 3 family protein [Vicinamibacterales bacterium]